MSRLQPVRATPSEYLADLADLDLRDDIPTSVVVPGDSVSCAPRRRRPSPSHRERDDDDDRAQIKMTKKPSRREEDERDEREEDRRRARRRETPYDTPSQSRVTTAKRPSDAGGEKMSHSSSARRNSDKVSHGSSSRRNGDKISASSSSRRKLTKDKWERR